MLEVCCGSFADAMEAYGGGAGRIELNSGLELGGLTPSLGSLIMTKQYTDLFVAAMIRMRGGGFCYTEYEYEQMKEDGKLMLSYGADAIVFGFLTKDRDIDRNRTKEFVQLAHSQGKEAVFHRAFDCVNAPFESMELLINLGIDRVLTSGLEKTAEEGIPMLMSLNRRFGNRVSLMAGSGVLPGNTKEIMEQTGIQELHSSCKDYAEDPSTAGNGVSYQIDNGKGINAYGVVSGEKVKELMEQMI